jgi:SAM-dependent methyltransferase
MKNNQMYNFWEKEKWREFFMLLNEEIYYLENELRKWFTQGLTETDRIIDGFDIGWGGTACYATSVLAKYLNPKKSHNFLDVACGYGTFLVELGWRFPLANLVGLNLDFDPPHNLITSLLTKGGVNASLILADVLKIPIIPTHFDCISCFLGLQDIAITRGKENLKNVILELLQAVSPKKYLFIVDNLPIESLKAVLHQISIDYDLILQQKFIPNCQWNRDVGNRAIEMYAQGYLQQELVSDNPPSDPEQALKKIHNKMLEDLENQLSEKGYFNPWGIMHLLLIQRI